MVVVVVVCVPATPVAPDGAWGNCWRLRRRPAGACRRLPAPAGACRAAISDEIICTGHNITE